MKEDLFKYIQVLILFLSINLMASDLGDKNYIFYDFVPYQISKTSVGFNVYKQSNILTSFVMHNWFSKNLFINGSLERNKHLNLINLKYKFLLGYAYSFKNRNIKNLLLHIGYSRFRFNTIINNRSDILYGLLLNMKFKNFWFSPSYSRIYQDDYFNQITLAFTKSFNNDIIILFCYKILENKNHYLWTPYISLRYNI